MLILTSKMDASTSSEVTPDKLSQVVGGSLLPEPVHEPPGLMSHQDDLILRPHALLCNSGKIPAKQAPFVTIAPIQAFKKTLGRFGETSQLKHLEARAEGVVQASIIEGMCHEDY